MNISLYSEGRQNKPPQLARSETVEANISLSTCTEEKVNNEGMHNTNVLGKSANSKRKNAVKIVNQPTSFLYLFTSSFDCDFSNVNFSNDYERNKLNTYSKKTSLQSMILNPLLRFIQTYGKDLENNI